MLKFFRKIRQNLIGTGDIKRYLLYAIGEITLVMVGILLALQVNNWNQKQLEHSTIKEALSEIAENLAADNSQLKALLQLRIEDYRAQKRIIKAFENNAPMDSTIQQDLGRVIIFREFYSIRNGYDVLKEIGVKKIVNRTLRNSISNYYDRSVPELKEAYISDKGEFETVLLPYVRHHFKEWIIGKYGIPHDYQHISQDAYFLTSLKLNLINSQFTVDRIENCLLMTNNLIELIEKETNK